MSTAAWSFYMELAINSVEGGDLTEAEELCLSAVREAESSDPQGQRLAASLQALATLACHRGCYARAEQLYYRAWNILQAACGEAAPETAAALAQVAGTCLMQNRHDEAEPLFTAALAALEQSRAPQLTAVIRCLHGLGDIHSAAKRRVAAVAAYQRALAMLEREEGAAAPSIFATLHKLGDLYLNEGRYAEAEPYFCRARKIAAADAAGSAAVSLTMRKLAEIRRPRNGPEKT